MYKKHIFQQETFLNDGKPHYATPQNTPLNMPDNHLSPLTFESISPTFSLLAFDFRPEACK